MKNAIELVKDCESELTNNFKKIEEISLFNQEKVLNALRNQRLASRHFVQTNGYGYSDEGREILARVYAEIFKAEDAIVSPFFACGSHAISVVLYAILRPNDTMLAITGKPYDTLDEVIKGVSEDSGSLKDFGINYEQIDLINGEINTQAVLEYLKSKSPKLVFIQRSRGYSARNPLDCKKIADIISQIRQINKEVFIVVDNCYGEFVQTTEPTEFGADICVGSLIKNPGGGIAPTGGYVVGTKRAVDLVGKRLFSPSLGTETGSYAGGYRLFFQGLFLAPHIVSQAVKGMMLLGAVATKLGFKIFPQTNEPHLDIIKSIEFNTKEELIDFCQLIQAYSPVESYVKPEPWAMPGYTSEVIMAAGTFVQGASIELSCDAPIRAPYIIYIQGGLTYEHVKLVAIKMAEKFLK
ncbi:MAG: methionine gamma-lyase family protein [Clostridia bacterium]